VLNLQGRLAERCGDRVRQLLKLRRLARIIIHDFNFSLLNPTDETDFERRLRHDYFR